MGGFILPTEKFASDDNSLFPRTSQGTTRRELDEELAELYRDDTSMDNSTFTHEDGGMCIMNEDGTKGNEIYFVGIIDILQRYNQRKKVENFFRGMKIDRTTISAAPPELYARRLCDFMESKVV